MANALSDLRSDRSGNAASVPRDEFRSSHMGGAYEGKRTIARSTVGNQWGPPTSSSPYRGAPARNGLMGGRSRPRYCRVANRSAPGAEQLGEIPFGRDLRKSYSCCARSESDPSLSSNNSWSDQDDQGAKESDRPNTTAKPDGEPSTVNPIHPDRMPISILRAN